MLIAQDYNFTVAFEENFEGEYCMHRSVHHMITGLSRSESIQNETGRATIERIFFRIQDLEWLLLKANRNFNESDVLSMAVEVSGLPTIRSEYGYYAFPPTASFVGKSRKWVCVEQYSGEK